MSDRGISIRTWATFLAAAILAVCAQNPAAAEAVGVKTCGKYAKVAPSQLKFKPGSHSMVESALIVSELRKYNDTVLCLLNAERKANGLPAFTQNSTLTKAALAHAGAAQKLKWWVGSADSHTNPQTKSTPQVRVRTDAGYCPNARSFVVGENTYHAAGPDAGPNGAVNWWMNISKSGHREAILDPKHKEVGIGLAGQMAAPGISNPRMGLYVITFGSCVRNFRRQAAQEGTK